MSVLIDEGHEGTCAMRETNRLYETLIGTLCILAFVQGCTECRSASTPYGEQVSAMNESDALELAKDEAERLGYDVGSLDMSVQRTAEYCVVTMLPRANQLGGDLVVKINVQTRRVVSVVRGQ